ncbi:hypothetical protein CR513_29460, partial [Mucuna pruriens]
MKVSLEVLHLGKTVEEDYGVFLLPDNPTLAQIRSHKEKNQERQRHVYLLVSLKPSSQETRFSSHRKIVEKILVIVPERYEASITSLENIKDLSKITLA